MPFVENGRSVFLPNVAFPIATDKVPEGYKGWLLFLDEISNAPMSVQAAAYKLILDREVGLHKLHDSVKIVSAGNKLDDGAAVVAEMSTALKSRMAHINIEVSISAWMDWALTNNVHHSITSFIQFKPTALYAFNPNSAEDTFPCPRTWGMLNNIVTSVGMSDPSISSLASAVIGDGPAMEYINYCKNFVNAPTFDQIINNPEGVDVPKELSTLYALSGSIGAQTTKETAEAVMTYVAKMPREFQLRTFNDMTKRDPSLVIVPSIRKWVTTNAKDLLSV